MRRCLALAASAVLLFATAACFSDPEELGDDAQQACDEYHQLVNDWSAQYGAELGAVGEANAAGDEERQETAVAVVQELFATFAADMRTQADAVSHDELSTALSEAAEGLQEIADGIQEFNDVTAAPDRMSNGTFADAGERVSDICADA